MNAVLQENPSPETEEKKVRVSYKQDASTGELTITRADDGLVADITSLPEDVRTHLSLLGLTMYLQRETTRVPDEEKLSTVESAYNEIVSKGMKVFEPKPRGFQSKGPRKADKIAALAMLKGTTPAVIEAKLKEKSDEDVDRILNHAKVLEKVAELQAKADTLDL